AAAATCSGPASSASSATRCVPRPAGCSGPAPRQRCGGRASWRARSAPASTPPSRRWRSWVEPSARSRRGQPDRLLAPEDREVLRAAAVLPAGCDAGRVVDDLALFEDDRLAALGRARDAAVDEVEDLVVGDVRAEAVVRAVRILARGHDHPLVG